ncbi:MAG: MFS transporter [Clostridia bacterium]|nr:MFS transporter [Clostridia bacterium]
MSYKTTRFSCYVAYIISAVVNNFLPLLFVMFNEDYGVTYPQLSILIFFNFAVQLLTDVASIKLVRKIGSRTAAVASNVISCAGFVLLAFLPTVMESTLLALFIAVFFTSVGAGLIEVIISPIMDRLPAPETKGYMAFLHSFYCWGQILVTVVTTVILKFAGNGSWSKISLLWAAPCLLNSILLCRVPIVEDVSEEKRTPLKTLFGNKLFVLIVLIMFAAGASELAIAQWASAFAETSLGLPKMTGDILGPSAFALFMGIGRVASALLQSKIGIRIQLIAGSALSIVCYLVSSLATNALVSVFACALCGLGVSILWPGLYSLASATFKTGGNAMFSVLAMAGDIGCSVGPWVLGMVAGDGGFKTAILVGTVFPFIAFVGLLSKRFR